MLKLFFYIILFFSISFATSAKRYVDPGFKVSKTKNIVYAKNIPHLAKKHKITNLVSGLKLDLKTSPTLSFYQDANETASLDLTLDLYEPKNDTLKKRPLIIVVHGGAFIFGSKNNSDDPIIAYCDSLATRGYVVAAIDYRIGLVLNEKSNKLIVDSLDFFRAIQWSLEDLKNAIQFFKINSESYRIDSNKIFVMGNSSGAILALESAIDNFDESPKAVISLWGAALKLSEIKNIQTPILLIHGTKDQIIPFKKGRLLNLDSAKKSQNFLGYESIIKAYNLNFESPIFYGSSVIDSILTKENVFHKSYFVKNEGHEFYYKEPYKTSVLNQTVEFLIGWIF